MDSEFKRELNINVNTNVNTQKIKDAEKIVNNFFNKYDGESIRLGIDTKQTKVEVSEFTKMVQNAKNLAEEIGTVKTQSPSMLPALRQDMEFLDSIKAELESTFAVFNDGTTVQGFDAITSKILDGFAIVAVDLGKRMQYIKTQISDTLAELEALGSIQKTWYGGIDFTSGNMDRNQIQERIQMIRTLFEYQRELEAFQQTEFTQKTSPIKHQTRRESSLISMLEEDYAQLEEYNLKTTEQLQRRKQIIEQIESSTWEDWEHDEAKTKIHDDDAYQSAIENISRYIAVRRDAIEQLQSTEMELFSVDGIEKYIATANDEIIKLENNLQELKNLREDTNIGNTGNTDLTAVLTALKEIEQAVRDITNAFKPFTDALSMDDGALSKVLSTKAEELDTFSLKLREVYQMIETLSNKQFNVTNVISNGNSSQNDLEQIRQFRQEARAAFKQVKDLYAETMVTASKLKNHPGGVAEIFNLNALLGEFDIADLAKRIKSRSATSLGVVVDELNEWKKILLQFNLLRNNVEAGSFDVSKYSDIASKANIGGKTFDADGPKSSDEDILDSNDIVSDIRSLSEKVEAEFAAIRAIIESAFDLSTIDPKLENIKSITDTIYQQFVELQNKINALDLNLNIPTVVSADTKTTENVIDDAAKAMNNEGESAEDAVPKKDAFTQANERAAKSAENTEEATKGAAEGVAAEAKAVEQSAGAIVEASDKFDKIKYINTIDKQNVPHPYAKTITSTTKRENAYETATTFSEYNEDTGRYDAKTETIITDFKKRASELKKESDKIALAQKTVDKFISQFESKTAGQASTIKGFDSLKNFKINNLDDIEKATQQMLELDNEYNKITKSFREGTKSMNPFVNAITGIGEMENKIKEVGIDFDNLNTKPAELSSEVAFLTPLLEKMKSFISTGADGQKTITDIYGLSEAYGQLNSALRQVNSNIKVQKKIDSTQSKNANFGLDLDRQLQALTKQQAQWKKNGQLTDEVRQKIDSMFDSLADVTNSSELSAWKKQWAIIKDEVAETRYEVEAAGQAQKQETQNFDKVIGLQNQLYDAQKQLAKVDAGSAKGQELTRKIAVLQQEYDIALDLLSKEEERAAVADRQLQLEKELNTVKLQTQNSYGKTIYNRENRYFGSITTQENNLTNSGLTLSADFAAKLDVYKAAFRELEDLRRRFIEDPDAFNNNALQAEFLESTQKVEGLRKEILSTFKEAQKFEQISSDKMLGVTTFDPEQVTDAKLKMLEFSDTLTDGKFKFEGFNAAGTEMYGTLNKGAGVVEKVTVALRAGTNQMYAYRTGTKAASDSWNKLGQTLKQSAAHMATMYLSFQDLIRYARQGIEYVKEIDLALTELKKVTNETDETYKNFLKTASATSAVIGSTVSDFTDATAAFARLGYSIDESTKMAETAIVYKNVAD